MLYPNITLIWLGKNPETSNQKPETINQKSHKRHRYFQFWTRCSIKARIETLVHCLTPSDIYFFLNSHLYFIKPGMLCSQCGVEGGPLLHHVCLHGVFSKVCTNCFLRLHPHAFCPTCYLVYESESPIPNPSNASVVTCSSCSSSSHTTCVGPAPSNPYICPLCSNPNSPLFVYKDAEGGRKRIDETATRVLLAATKIAAVATNRAAAEAQEKALRKVQKAAFARRKAKEALINFWAIQEEADQAETSGLTDLESNDLSDLESKN